MRSLLKPMRYSVVFSAVMLLAAAARAEEKKPHLLATKFDPSAQQVGMFDGIKQDLIEVKIVPKDSFGGNVLITNKHTAPLTVKAPQGFVGVPINAQIGVGGGLGGVGGVGGGLGGGGLGGAGIGGGGFGGGGGQAVGGGLGGGGFGGGGFGGGGLGGGLGGGGAFGGGGAGFSIPAERTLRLPYVSVCLEHGKTEPNSKSAYKIVPLEDYTADPVLQQLVNLVGTGALDLGSAQACAWHVANGMSWQMLALKPYEQPGQPNRPFFNIAQLQGAQNILAVTYQRVAEAKERAESEPQPAEPVAAPNPREESIR